MNRKYLISMQRNLNYSYYLEENKKKIIGKWDQNQRIANHFI